MKLKEQPSWLSKYFFSPLSMPRTIRSRPTRFLVCFIGWAILALLPVYCLFMTEYIHFANKIRTFEFFANRSAVVLFDLCILYILWVCVLLLVKKGWLATLIYSGVFGLAACVDYLKYAMTGDYFYPWDLLQQAGNIGELTNFITVPFPPLYTFMIVFGLLLSVAVYFSGASVPLRWQVRCPVLALIVGCTLFSVSTPEKITTLLNRNSLYIENTALQSYNYSSNGFVGAFTVNVLSSNIQQPEDYNEASIDQLMAPFTDQPAAEDFSSPDIILILSESFWDPTLLPGTTFSSDPLAGYRALCQEENAISGRFFTTGLGGGTVRPEFEVLTGMTSDYLPSGSVPWQYITDESVSYVSAYQELGYTTMAIHPYTSSFYNRKDAYPLIGFDALYFQEDIYALDGQIDVIKKGNQISDETFAESIRYYMDGSGNSPVFVFGISMENHQPYTDKFNDHYITVENSAFDSDVSNAVSNFTRGVSDADQCLTELAEYVKNRDKDTILIWFGDHLPTLGSNLGAYRQSGALDVSDDEYYEFLYSTPFVIYANFELNESDMLHPGTDNNIASYNLMNAAAELIGAPRTDYMEFLKAYYLAEPYYNVRLHKALSDEAFPYANGHKLLTYDRIAGFGYSLDQ